MKRNGWYNVAPRFTSGSPAQVDEWLALRVLKQEQEAHSAALEGYAGAAEQAKARLLGLDGVVELVTECREGFLVHDMATGRDWIRPTKFGSPSRFQYRQDDGRWVEVDVLVIHKLEGTVWLRPSDAPITDPSRNFRVNIQDALSDRRVRYLERAR